MRIYNVLIVDDEPEARALLEHYLQQLSEFKLVASCKNALSAFKIINEQQVDLLLLDIHMPQMSGVSLAKNIPAAVKVIFTTAHRDYAVEGFELRAVDYLLKPIPLERFVKAMYKFLAENNPDRQPHEPVQSPFEAPFIFVRSDRKMVKISLDEIKYIESLQDYLKIHLDENVIITRETMAKISSLLNADYFLRCHRSYIVALKHISSYTNEHINLDRKAIPVSRSYKDQVMDKLKKFGV